MKITAERKRPTERQVTWACSIMGDRGATAVQKRAARAIIAWSEEDPDEQPDYLDDGFPDDDY